MQFHPYRAASALSLVTVLLATGGCDNVGRAFDRDVTPPTNPGGSNTSTIQVPEERGDFRDGRPLVRATYPRGGGWPTTVPIVVEFSESMNESSVLPTTTGGSDGRVIVRVEGTEQALPAAYDFFAQGRVLVLRPPTGLSNQGAPVYEVVLLPGARDVDGIRFSNSNESVLATFTVDQDPAVEDGGILAVFPRDNARDVARDTTLVAVFDKPANVDTIDEDSFKLRTAAAGDIAGTRLTPLRLPTNPGAADGRVMTFEPTAELAGETSHEIAVTAAITFGAAGGVLDFNGRNPFARFTTTGVPRPTAVRVGNPTPITFPDQVNRANLESLTLAVDVPAEAAIGDRVVARIYGVDPADASASELLFFQRDLALAVAGQQTVLIDLAGALGTVAQPRLREGDVTLVTQLRRGQAHSGVLVSGDGVRLDVTLPEVLTVGPPAVGDDLFVDTLHVAFFGRASEQLAEAAFTDGVGNSKLFGSSANGDFLIEPLQLGRLTGPRPYSLVVTDLAGNMAAGAHTGNIWQRGVITGGNATTLTVEAYDDATLQVVAGVTVLVEAGEPVIGAAGRVSLTTGADGRAAFSGLALGSRTITLLADGYDIVTLYDHPAAFVSLPLRRTGGAVATLAGTVAVVPVPGQTTLVGSNLFDDPILLGVATATATPNAIPETPVRPNRPVAISGFAGAAGATARPFFTAQGCNLCGVDLVTPSAPAAGAAAGATLQAGVAVVTAAQLQLPEATLSGDLPAPVLEDWSLAVGLNTSALVGGAPVVRVTMSMFGFAGQLVAGIGAATQTAGASFNSDASYSRVLPATAGSLFSSGWLLTEARDDGGRISRVRSLLAFNFGNGSVTVTDVLDPPAVPQLNGQPAVAAPLVLINDVIDPALIVGGSGRGLLEVLAVDGAGRRWSVLREDVDPAPGTFEDLQFPDLTGLAGLQYGDWSMRANARLFIDVFGAPGQFVLSERSRQEATYSRGAAVTVTVSP